MLLSGYFVDVVKKLQSILPSKKNKIAQRKLCDACDDSKYYSLSGIRWSGNTIHMITKHHSYPSEYFIKVMSNICIINDRIINPPLKIPRDMISSLNYIRLCHNRLLIFDALMHNGSKQIYEYENKNIYSEHSGIISIKNNAIESISVSTTTDRIDINDDSIFLPRAEKTSYEHEYMFHTHPSTNINGERMKAGILYEFPSSNDVFYFVQCHNQGISQGSIVITPEGTYVIRTKKYTPKITLDEMTNSQLNSFIIQLEKDAYIKNKNIISKLNDADDFHKYVSYNFDYIDKYNDFIGKHNIMIEYYPREKKNGNWFLREMSVIQLGKN